MAESISTEVVLNDEELEAKEGTLKEIALSRYRRHVRDNATHMSELKQRADADSKFVSPLGDQWPDQVKEIFQKLGMPALTLNEVHPTIRSIAGRETTQRFQPKLTGADSGDQGFADACNAAMMRVRQEGNYEQIDSAVYLSSHICGLSASCIVTELQRRVPRFRLEKTPISELLIDFYGRQPNYSDGTALARGQWVNLYEMQQYYPLFEDLWNEIVQMASGATDFDDVSTSGSSTWEVVSGVGIQATGYTYYRRSSREVFLVDFEWADYERMVEIEMPGEALDLYQQQEGDTVPEDDLLEDTDLLLLGYLTAQAEQLIQQQIEQYQQQVQMAQQQGADPGQIEPYQPKPRVFRKVTPKSLLAFQQGYSELSGESFESYYEVKERQIYHAIIVGEHVLRVWKKKDNAWDVTLDVCYMDETAERSAPYSSVSLMRPRQEWANMFLCTWLNLLATMPKAQFAVDVDEVGQDTVNQLNSTIARGDQILGIPGGTGSLKPLPKGTIPEGVTWAAQFWPRLVPGAVGLNQYGIGNVSDSLSRTAFRLVSQQIEQQDKTLAEPLDNFRLYRKEQTRSLLRKMFAYWSPDDFRRAAGTEFEQYIPDDKSLWYRALDWDVVVGEEPVTKDQAQTAIEALHQTAMWQKIYEDAPEAVADIHSTLFGSAITAAWKEGIRARKPEIMIFKLAEVYGIDPEQLSQALQNMLQQQQTGEETAVS